MRVLLALFLSFALSLQAEESATTIQADNACFDGAKIVLTGNVEVLNESCRISSKKAVLYRDEEKLSRLDFPWVDLLEGVSASFYGKYFLNCSQVHFDHLTKKLHFTGKERVYFYDDIRKIYADRAEVDYEERGEDFEIKKILLTGNVEMYSFALLQNQNVQKNDRYALADFVEYYPEEEVVLLKSDINKRVLFFDKSQSITISAPMVRAERREGREMIEGIGDVRFTFKEEELTKLKNRFELP
jgi:lipopolysaccharide export system protein LptA